MLSGHQQEQAALENSLEDVKKSLLSVTEGEVTLLQVFVVISLFVPSMSGIRLFSPSGVEAKPQFQSFPVS